MSVQPGIPESAVTPNQEQSNISPIVFKAKRGQSVEVTPEGGYKIHLPWWDRLRMRIESTRKKHGRDNSGSFFTPREIRQILKHPEKPYHPKGIDGILKHSFAYIQAIEGASSSVPGMKVWGYTASDATISSRRACTVAKSKSSW